MKSLCSVFGEKLNPWTIVIRRFDQIALGRRGGGKTLVCVECFPKQANSKAPPPPPPPQSKVHEQSSSLEQLRREHSVEQESTTTEALQTQTQSEGKTDLVHCISIYMQPVYYSRP